MFWCISFSQTQQFSITKRTAGVEFVYRDEKMCKVRKLSGKMKVSSTLLFIIFFFFHLVSTCSAKNSLDPTQVLRDGEELISEDGIFILGFFNPGKSRKRYLGIWYNFSVDTVVWVANRNDPILDSSGELKITSTGELILLRNQSRFNSSTTLGDEDRDGVVWSSNSTTPVGARPSNNPTHPQAKLLKSGNLVVVDTSKGSINASFIWQSFDHLSDSFIPGMKIGIDLKSNYMWNLTSWKSEDDPSVGNFTFSVSRDGLMDFIVYNTDTKIFRTGPWNGRYSAGMPEATIYFKYFRMSIVDKQKEVTYRIKVLADDMFSILRLYPNGTLIRIVWTKNDPRWTSYFKLMQDKCNSYNKCGPNAVCRNEDPQLCRCYRGFKQKVPSLWNKRVFTDGCVRKERLNCSRGEGFLRVVGVKFPDTTNGYALIDRSVSNLEDCRDRCKRNCSCVAYAAIYLSDFNPRGCIMWTGDLVDTKLLKKGEQDLFLRLPQSELPASPSEKIKMLISLAIGLPLGLVLILLCSALFLWRKRKDREMQRARNVNNFLKDSNLLVFDFAALALATDNFSNEKEIGQGGFGVVYKGRILDGQDVAAKRLFRDASRQGVDEFVNEVTLIAKLQHRNLVRLLGCCMEADERILVYEFLPNNSLDSVIFGEKSQLDWGKRVEIITGIARGLLYLHHDSRLRIIHRDLKAANVLLDDAMNPKICDFGTARIFGADQMEDNTRRIIGTYGYMAPEYAMEGIFSTKSDVFSFGVLMLEIISGRKNNRVVDQEENEVNLLEKAWRLWIQGKSLELVNSMLLENSLCLLSEIICFIQIGLLCVQNDATDRPAMSTVLFMLNNKDGSSLPKPKRPGFHHHHMRRRCVQSSSFVEPPTMNKLTFTTLQGR